MAFVKGTPKPPGSGKKKGTPNKITAELKDMIREALDKAGGVEYLLAQSRDNPTAFLTLVGKILPLQVSGTVNHNYVMRIPDHSATVEQWQQNHSQVTIQ